MRNQDKFRGCLIGGAAGDALGYAVEFMREDEIFRKYGENGITEYDLRNGKPEEFINRVLNPMNEEFLTTVKAQRPALAQLDNDAPVLRGEIYFTQESIGLGLADGVSTFVDAVAEAYQMGRQYSEALKLKHNLYNL